MFTKWTFCAVTTLVLATSCALAEDRSYIPASAMRPISTEEAPVELQMYMKMMAPQDDTQHQVTLEQGFKRGDRACVVTQGKGARAKAKGTIKFVGSTIDDVRELVYKQLKSENASRAETFNSQAEKYGGEAGLAFWGFSLSAAYSKETAHTDSSGTSSFDLSNDEKAKMTHSLNEITHEILVDVDVEVISQDRFRSTSCAFVEVYALTVDDKTTLFVSQSPQVGASNNNGAQQQASGTATAKTNGPPIKYF